ncbi:hypothetical protein RUM43_007309 [Polyplax serrata]|uniref:OPA3-like protein n=1 Tax=Polyplax serrata TaxID=468196 RepID=A0AAN8P1Q0_POLSC
MVAAAFPLAKIGLLLMKQLSKPLANVIKKRAKKHPSIRKYIIIPIGRAYGWVEHQATHVRGEPRTELKLSDEDVVELGANAIGEIILFGLLTVILLAEYNRQGDKKAVIQKIKEDEISNLVDTVLQTIDDVAVLKKSVAKLEKTLISGIDAVQMEEEKHPPVYDNDFLDVMLERPKLFKSKRVSDMASRSA